MADGGEVSRLTIRLGALLLYTGTLWLFYRTAGRLFRERVGLWALAIALASKGVLEDLFGYYAILLDRLFELGDFIVIADLSGTVEQIGIKTTRLRSLSGEQLILANTQLLSGTIQNFKRMTRRRGTFSLSVDVETPADVLAEIPAIVQQSIAACDRTTYERAHFFQYGEAALKFEIAYYVEGSDYTLYMDIQQQINLAIKREFERRGIKLADPARLFHPSGSTYGKQN